MISVALCTYNGEKFLSEQLDSILGQTYKVDEIIICDDGSSDNTSLILEDYRNRFPDVIKVLYNKESLRVIKNFEQAIEKSTGDIILLCDQDDVWKENKVDRIVNYFQKNPGILAVFHELELMDEDNHALGETMLNKLGVNKQLLNHIKEKNLWFQFLLSRNLVTGAAMAIKNEAKKYIFPFITNNVAIIHDYDMALVLSNQNKFDFLEEKLGYYRIHSAQQVGVKQVGKFDFSMYDKLFLGEEIDNKEALRIYYQIYLKYKAIESKLENKSIEKKLYDQVINQKDKYFKSIPLVYRLLYTSYWSWKKIYHLNDKDD